MYIIVYCILYIIFNPNNIIISFLLLACIFLIDVWNIMKHPPEKTPRMQGLPAEAYTDACKQGAGWTRLFFMASSQSKTMSLLRKWWPARTAEVISGNRLIVDSVRRKTK